MHIDVGVKVEETDYHKRSPVLAVVAALDNLSCVFWS
jgi:hypothetical protein